MSHKGAAFQTHLLLAMGSSAFSLETHSGSTPTEESKQAPCLPLLSPYLSSVDEDPLHT